MYAMNTTTLRRGRRATSIVLLCTATALIGCTAGDPLEQDEDSAAIAVRNDDSAEAPLDAASVSIQRLEKPTEFADTKLFVTLSKGDAEKLANPQVVGAGDEDAPIVLRDDGKGGDEKAGDLVFTGLAFADIDALKARAEAEAKQDVKDVPQFVGRSVEKLAPAEALDLDKFLGGGVIKLPGAPKLLFSLANARHSLMITDPSVVRDFTRTYDPCTDTGAAMGPWSFGHLMTELANQPLTGIDPAHLAEDWLASWLTPQLPGSASIPVPARPMMQQLIDDWRAVSGGGDLDLKKAPFRLLAIVNRIDLSRRGKGGGGYGGGIGGDFLDAGEGRFVFGLVLPAGYTVKGYNKPGVLDSKTGCRLTPFTVIFEYKVDRPGCKKVRDWAQQWRALDTLPFGATYNAALQTITDQFTVAGASPSRGNRSALGQLRTNDFLMAPLWQMREHQLPLPTGFLSPHQVADTVELFHNNTTSFGAWIVSNLMQLPPQSFPWAGASDVPSPGTFWDGAHSAIDTLLISSGPGNDANDARQNVSFSACSGCHARETDTDFVHIDNRTPLGAGQEALLSEFLLGEKVSPFANNAVTGNLHFVDDPSVLARGGVINPTNPQHRRGFRDLEFRQQKLVEFATQSCLRVPVLDPVLVEDALTHKKALPDDLFKDAEPLSKDKLPTFALERLGDAPVAQVH